MYPHYEHKKSVLSFRLSLLLALLLVIIITATSLAYSNPSQGFARKLVSNARGTQADMYTGNPPSPYWFIANLTAICQTNPCGAGSYFFETGWIRGVQTFGTLRHYISWRGTSSSNWQTGTSLSINTWYSFQTLHSNSANRWEGWLNGVPKLYLTQSLGWTSGNLVTCGLESKHNGTPPTAAGWCNNTKYKVGSGSWTNYIYDHEIELDYCVTKPWIYGSMAYGPVTGSCPP